MNKEILEITKKFHNTYEKLASAYTYETIDDTKVFDINSNNGKLMYATVNEIVSPILKENKILKENAENNDKVIDKVNWENMLLKKENEQLKDLIDTILNSSFFTEECPLNFGFENTNEDIKYKEPERIEEFSFNKNNTLLEEDLEDMKDKINELVRISNKYARLLEKVESDE